MTEIGESEHHATLTCVAGKYAGKTFHVTNEATIGRAGENSILLDAMVVSNRHARLYFDDASSTFVIEDLGSRTGIMIDDDFIDDRAVLRDGQEVTIANEFKFTFHIGTIGEGDSEDKAESPRPDTAAVEKSAPVTPEKPAPQSATPPEPESPAGTGTKAVEEPPAKTPAVDQNLPRRRAFFLERSGTEGEQITFSLTEGINLVGRDPSNTIHLQDGSVSRHHAVIVVKDGNLLVRDLDSKNHTFVDGVRVEHEREMHIGSVVLFGLMAFVVREKS